MPEDWRITAFIVITLILAFVSRRSLRSTASHGFYRFFVFEGTAALVLLNVHVWTNNPEAELQAVSSVFLYSSILVGALGFLQLRLTGGSGAREAATGNFAFENTARIVERGIYRYVRHPMYASLALLAWGAFIKGPTPLSTLLVLLTTGLVVATAKVEERENLKFFGADYRSYMSRSKMFIPFVV